MLSTRMDAMRKSHPSRPAESAPTLDFLRILFSPGIAVPLILVLSAAFLMRRFYVLNYRSDDMRKFTATGAGKLGEAEFRRLARMRRLFGNALIISSLTAVAAAYAAFCAFCVF